MNVIISIFVSLISGLIGVIVGSWLSQKRELEREKIEMLSVLIAKRDFPSDMRRTEVLNCIPIVFRKNQNVCKAFEEYKKAHDAVTENLNNSNVIFQKLANLQDHYIKIMDEMAKDLKLGSNISWDKLKNPYIPQYYSDMNGKIFWY